MRTIRTIAIVLTGVAVILGCTKSSYTIQKEYDVVTLPGLYKAGKGHLEITPDYILNAWALNSDEHCYELTESNVQLNGILSGEVLWPGQTDSEWYIDLETFRITWRISHGKIRLFADGIPAHSRIRTAVLEISTERSAITDHEFNRRKCKTTWSEK